MLEPKWTLSEFCNMEIVRTGDVAEIIVDYYKGDKDKPIRLLNYMGDASMSDYEIAEEGYLYYLELVDALNEIPDDV